MATTKRLADWLETPLSNKQLEQVEIAFESFESISTEKRDQLYNITRSFLLGDTISTKERAFSLKYVAPFESKVASFMGFFHRLVSQYEGSIYIYEYTKLYKYFFDKGIASNNAAQITSHFGTYEDKTYLPDVPEVIVEERQESVLETAIEILTKKVSNLSQSFAEATEKILALSAKDTLNQSTLVNLRSQLNELEEQVQELEQSNLNGDSTSTEFSLNDIYANLPPNTHITITINKGE